MSNEILDLSNITYFSVLPNSDNDKNNNIKDILKIGYETSKDIKFSRKVIYTAQKPDCDTFDFDVIEIDPIPYNKFDYWILKNYKDLFDSDFMINFQGDGMIRNPTAWSKNFLDYDYIGAPWSQNFEGGNGGFSLRSKNMCRLMSEIDLTQVNFENTQRGSRDIQTNEDVLICRTNNEFLKICGIKFAPNEISSKFSTEHWAFENSDFYDSFGFHEINSLSNTSIKNDRINFLNATLNA